MFLKVQEDNTILTLNTKITGDISTELTDIKHYHESKYLI